MRRALTLGAIAGLIVGLSSPTRTEMDCRPDEFPPYEPVPEPKITVLIGSPLSKAEATFIGHTLLWMAFGFAVVRLLGLL